MTHITPPELAPITRHLRAMYGSRLLVAAVCHLNVFEQFNDGPLNVAELARKLGLKDRPAKVLFPALGAMGFLTGDAAGNLAVTDTGRYLTKSARANLIGYLGLEQNDPGVLEMVERLRHDGPLDQAGGTAYVKEGAEASPMDDPILSRQLTLALSGRARHLSPLVAHALPRKVGHLLDVAGGTGLFACEWLRLNPESTATVFDRPQVLQVAEEFVEEFCDSAREGAADVRDRLDLCPGNMLDDELPPADLILAASLFHDWPEETCETLARRFAQTLDQGGELWAHDAYLNDTMDGPLPVTDYSAQLFWVTKGRCYSRAEYRRWFALAGLVPAERNVPTALDYSLIYATKA